MATEPLVLPGMAALKYHIKQDAIDFQKLDFQFMSLGKRHYH